jgi:hypothetical protein
VNKKATSRNKGLRRTATIPLPLIKNHGYPEEQTGMKKKNKFLILVLASALAAGSLVYSNQPPTTEKNDSTAARNHIGDLRFKSGDFEEVSALQHSMITAKSGETAPAAPQSGPAPGSPKDRPAQDTKTYPAQPRSSPAPSPEPSPDQAQVNPLRSRIEQAYISRLQSLASGYEGKLNGLVAAALDECSAARKDNPNADLGPLINKYYSAAKALEAECDSQFYSLLASFESELRANSFPLDMAAQARGAYEARKSARAAQITSGRP